MEIPEFRTVKEGGCRDRGRLEESVSRGFFGSLSLLSITFYLLSGLDVWNSLPTE